MASEGKQRKKWRDEGTVPALDDVTEKTLMVSQAASMYHVPRKMLDDRVKERVVHGIYHAGWRGFSMLFFLGNHSFLLICTTFFLQSN